VSTVAEYLERIQREQCDRLLNVAKLQEDKAQHDVNTASLGTDKARVELKTAELLHHRMKQANRPSIILGAMIRQDEDDAGKITYTATYAGVSAEGDSPEIAFANFDRAWSQGHNDE
jgi:hypothetical protein